MSTIWRQIPNTTSVPRPLTPPETAGQHLATEIYRTSHLPQLPRVRRRLLEIVVQILHSTVHLPQYSYTRRTIAPSIRHMAQTRVIAERILVVWCHLRNTLFISNHIISMVYYPTRVRSHLQLSRNCPNLLLLARRYKLRKYQLHGTAHSIVCKFNGLLLQVANMTIIQVWMLPRAPQTSPICRKIHITTWWLFHMRRQVRRETRDTHTRN